IRLRHRCLTMFCFLRKPHERFFNMTGREPLAAAGNSARRLRCQNISPSRDTANYAPRGSRDILKREYPLALLLVKPFLRFLKPFLPPFVSCEEIILETPDGIPQHGEPKFLFRL